MSALEEPTVIPLAPSPPTSQPATGLVLAGGGARGAYEVGVLDYIFNQGPAELRAAAQFHVLCGTSVGAINISAFAAGIEDPGRGVTAVVDLWRGLRLESLMPLSWSDLASIPAWIFGRKARESLVPGGSIKGFLEDQISWPSIQANFANGHLKAMAISATHVRTGKTEVFYQTRDGKPRPWSSDPHVRSTCTRLTASHARASAAIPLIFPSVSINNQPYVDGGLRQNTPLSPALRLGANRLLVIDLRHDGGQYGVPGPEDWDQRPLERSVNRPAFLLGKVLNALLLDHVDYDLIRMETINRILLDGQSAFGDRFVERLNSVVAPVRGAPYDIVPSVVIRPSRDLGQMAAEYVRDGGLDPSRSLVHRMVSLLARGEPDEEADLTSYLLFDGGFCERLINLGVEDAAARRDDLMGLFSGAPLACGQVWSDGA